VIKEFVYHAWKKKYGIYPFWYMYIVMVWYGTIGIEFGIFLSAGIIFSSK